MATDSALSRAFRTGVIGVIAAAVVGGGDPAALGQPPSTPRSMLPAAAEVADPGPVVSVRFPGGTVQEFVEAVQRAAEPAPVNVLVPAGAAEVPLPPITLQGVTVKTALDAIQYAFPHGMGTEHAFAVRSFGDGSGAANAFAILYERAIRQPTPVPPQFMAAPSPPVQQRIQVFSLKELVSPPTVEGEKVGVPIDVLLTAVESAFGLEEAGAAEGEKPEAQVRFHEDSGLLIVRGTPDQIGLVSSLLSEVRRDVVGRWTEARQEAAREEERRYRDERLDLEMGLARREIALLSKRADELRSLVEAGSMPQAALDEAELKLAQRQGQLEMLQLERRRPLTDSADGPQSGRGGPTRRPGESGMDASVAAQLIVDLQRRVTELQEEVDRLRSRREPK